MGMKLVGPSYIEESGALCIIDVRRRREYEDGHLPGAVSLPVTEFVKSVGRLKDAPQPDVLAELMGRLGVGDGSPVLAYDDQWGVYAGRLLWTLEFYGHRDLYLLDRNFATYAAEGGTLTKEEPTVERALFSAAPNYRWAASIEDLSQTIQLGSGVVLDAGERMDFLNGHIPGALNLPWRMLVGDDRSFLPEDRLRRIFIEHGVDEKTDVVTYCKDGMTSSYLFTALRIVGHERVKLYSRGYAEWEDAKRPISAEFRDLMKA
jgi:thiosulfate/3-mercaptopyruvate sulfurtransferase